MTLPKTSKVNERVTKNWKTTLIGVSIILVCGILVYTGKVDFQTGMLVGVPTLIGGIVLKDKTVGL